MGEKTFEQAAGFLRIPGSENPLDDSAVHPERYGFVEKMAAHRKTTLKEMIGNTAFLSSIDKERYLSDALGLPAGSSGMLK